MRFRRRRLKHLDLDLRPKKNDKKIIAKNIDLRLGKKPSKKRTKQIIVEY